MVRAFLAAFALLIAGAAASAQDYPARPIRVLTSSSAGGLSDMFMRALGEEFQKATGQPIIIENRPGGMGNIASRACTEAAPDGYTICILNADNAAYNQHLFKNLPYDPDRLVPIVNLFHLIQVLVVNADLKVKTVDELVALSKAKPGTMNYLTASLPLVVFMESLKRDKGADWVRVPFKGGGEATNAIMSGTTPIGLLGLGNVLSQIESGKMTALVLTNNVRTPQLPNTPIFTDIGYTGAPSETWYGLFAPAGTPREIIDKLNGIVVKIASQPDFQKRHIIDRSLVPATGTPEAFAGEIRKVRAVAGQVVRDAGMAPP
jgi:tripartite-type tricarboxylate transporter receptor subunit TctC